MDIRITGGVDATDATTDNTIITRNEGPWEKVSFAPDEPQKVKEVKEVEDTSKFISLKDVSITNNDLIITITPSIGIYHIDLQRELDLSDILTNENSQLRRRRTGYSRNLISNLFAFDKNFNYLAVNRSKNNKIKIRRDRIRIDRNEIYDDSYEINRKIVPFVVINKEKFIQSEGKIWGIKYRQGISYEDMKEPKKHFQEKFAAMRTIIPKLRKIIGGLYPEENFDLRYTINNDYYKRNHFSIIIRHTNITIRNSIEMEHYIGDIVIKTTGIHKYGLDEAFPILILSSIYGMRMSFTASDAAMNYQHSHLSTTMHSFQPFCTGDENYGAEISDINEIDLEQILLRIEELLSWESLEGGPHFKMEDINIHGSAFSFTRGIMSNKSVTKRYIEDIIKKIQEKNAFDKLRNCFQLIIDRGTLRYILDQYKFFEEFIGIFGNDEIREIHIRFGESLYTYNFSNKKFIKISSISMTKAENIVQRGLKNIQTIRPVHLNGKYYRPYLTEHEGKDLLEGLLFSFNPDFMLEIANCILYHLTTELETYENN